jgi:UDPglucose 6-dehydrogenase
MLKAVDDINTFQKTILLKNLESHFQGDLAGASISIWGLAFKPRTDDVREAPALVLIDALLERGAVIRVHDPVAMANVDQKYGDRLTYASTPEDALDHAQALVIVTEWGEFRHPDLAQMRRRMAIPVVFDGRNLYEPEQMCNAGFTYYSIGRPPVKPE